MDHEHTNSPLESVLPNTGTCSQCHQTFESASRHMCSGSIAPPPHPSSHTHHRKCHHRKAIGPACSRDTWIWDCRVSTCYLLRVRFKYSILHINPSFVIFPSGGDYLSGLSHMENQQGMHTIVSPYAMHMLKFLKLHIIKEII